MNHFATPDFWYCYRSEFNKIKRWGDRAFE